MSVDIALVVFDVSRDTYEVCLGGLCKLLLGGGADLSICFSCISIL